MFQCFFQTNATSHFFRNDGRAGIKWYVLPLWKIQPGTQVLCEKRERLGFWQIYVTYFFKFPELLHVNFSVIGGKIFGPCLFCGVAPLANLSMDNVIDALAANVIITSTQTINRAWNFDGLANMVQESSAIDWLKAFTRVGVLNTVARSLVNRKGKAQGTRPRNLH